MTTIVLTALLGALLMVVTGPGATGSYMSFENQGHHPLYPIQPRLISQSVELKEIPTKIIRITKTVAVKVPVPYPVKIPHHIPVPLPVNYPVAVPVPQIVKVPEQVPITVEKSVPVELPQQVPLLIPKAVPLAQPVQVPKPFGISRPVFITIPKFIPYPSHDYQSQLPSRHNFEAAESNHFSNDDSPADYDGTESKTSQESLDENDAKVDDRQSEIQKVAPSRYRFVYRMPEQQNHQEMSISE